MHLHTYILLKLTPTVESAEYSVQIGSDLPYQNGIGLSRDRGPIRISLRTGILYGVYSDLTLNLISVLGTDEVYIDLLESSFGFGFMNSIGAYYLFCKKNVWYIGPEIRFDYLQAADTSSELVESITGSSIQNTPGPLSQEPNISLQLAMYAVGVRMGRTFYLAENHHIDIELSLYKHYNTNTRFFINEDESQRLTSILDPLLWEDVFLPYGYLGGIGLSYRYLFIHD